LTLLAPPVVEPPILRLRNAASFGLEERIIAMTGIIQALSYPLDRHLFDYYIAHAEMDRWGPTHWLLAARHVPGRLRFWWAPHANCPLSFVPQYYDHVQHHDDGTPFVTPVLPVITIEQKSMGDRLARLRLLFNWMSRRVYVQRWTTYGQWFDFPSLVRLNQVWGGVLSEYAWSTGGLIRSYQVRNINKVYNQIVRETTTGLVPIPDQPTLGLDVF